MNIKMSKADTNRYVAQLTSQEGLLGKNETVLILRPDQSYKQMLSDLYQIWYNKITNLWYTHYNIKAIMEVLYYEVGLTEKDLFRELKHLIVDEIIIMMQQKKGVSEMATRLGIRKSKLRKLIKRYHLDIYKNE